MKRAWVRIDRILTSGDGVAAVTRACASAVSGTKGWPLAKAAMLVVPRFYLVNLLSGPDVRVWDVSRTRRGRM